MRRYAKLLLTTAMLASLTAGCAASGPMSPDAPTSPAAHGPVLERSLYSKDGRGSLTEEELQKVLESVVDLQLPARVGVVPLAEPFDPANPVSIQIRSGAAATLAKELKGNPHYSQISDICTDLPKPDGIEGLRVIAARYRLRYLLLYSERFEDTTHLNGWAWLYPTLIGLFAAPGVTVESTGMAQVDLLDVRTGTILFTVVEPMSVSEEEWTTSAERAALNAQAAEAVLAAGRLAKRVAFQTDALVDFAAEAAKRGHRVVTHILPAPVAPAEPPPAPGSDATIAGSPAAPAP